MLPSSRIFASCRRRRNDQCALEVLLLVQRVPEIEAGGAGERRAGVLPQRAVEGGGLVELAVLVQRIGEVEPASRILGARARRALEGGEGLGVVAGGEVCAKGEVVTVQVPEHLVPRR